MAVGVSLAKTAATIHDDPTATSEAEARKSSCNFVASGQRLPILEGVHDSCLPHRRSQRFS